MSKLDIIRAWKDPDYRLSLTDSDRAKLPAHPAGLIELSDVDLGARYSVGHLRPGNAGKSLRNFGRCVCPHSCSTKVPDLVGEEQVRN
jgi:mersacidin/lichenicidin family type 2 lantibiotic